MIVLSGFVATYLLSRTDHPSGFIIVVVYNMVIYIIFYFKDTWLSLNNIASRAKESKKLILKNKIVTDSRNFIVRESPRRTDKNIVNKLRALDD